MNSDPIVTAVREDIDAFIFEGMRDFNKHFIIISDVILMPLSRNTYLIINQF